jgi:hypothetical protein
VFGWRRFIALALLLLVGVSLAYTWVASRQQRPGELGPAGAVLVCYFHSGTCCATCDKIEHFSYQAVGQAFSEQLRDGRLVWRDINYEEPENAQWAKEFRVLTACIVLVDTRGGGPPDFKNLQPQVWNLVQKDDTQGIIALVQNETRAMLGR